VNLAALPLKQRRIIFISVAIACAAGIPLAAELVPAPLYPLIFLAVFVIGLPLASGLFVYKKAASTFFVALATIAVLLGLIIVINGAINNKYFNSVCVHHGLGWSVLYDEEVTMCVGPSEADTYYNYNPLGPLAPLTFYVYVLSVFINLVNLIYLPFHFMRLATAGKRTIKNKDN